MPHPTRLTIVADDRFRTGIDRWRDAFAGASWPDATPADLLVDHRPLRTPVAIPEDAELLAVLADRETGPSTLDRLVDDAAGRGLPVVVLAPLPLPEPTRPGGFLALPLGTDAASILVAFAALRSRQREVDQLRDELATTCELSEGVRAEVARIDEEMQLAATVQREFLPRELPEGEGLGVATLWRPASPVSGDLFDIRRLDADTWGLLLVDAVGHGMPAALLAHYLGRALPTRETVDGRTRILPPGEALGRLNAELVARQGTVTRFATAVYATLEPARRSVRIASAGHPATIHLSRDGTCRRVETDGGLLGVFPDERYAETEVVLAPGDQLLFHTDGFEQAFPDPPVRAGSARPRRYVEELRRVAASDHAAETVAMVEGLLELARGRAGDDLTLVCVHAADAAALRRAA
jgi:sigma-B regulation protein RsbU (phosphoserine phosphatase)